MKTKLHLIAVSAVLATTQSAWAGKPDADHPALARALSAVKSHAQSSPAARGALAADMLNADDTLEATNLIVDTDGSEHVRFDRRYKGLRVVGGDMVVHGHSSGAHKGLSRTWQRGSNVDVRAKLSGLQATQAALKAFPHLQAKAGTRELIVWARDGKEQLAWDTSVNGVQADGTPSRMHVIVSAKNGLILDRWDDVHTADANASGRTLYAGNVSIKSDLANGKYTLVDATRGGHYVSDIKNKTDINLIIWNFPAAGTTSSSTTGVFGDNTTADVNSAAADASFGFATTWDYFSKVHGRNGIDGSGKKAYSRVHYGSNYNNAFWMDSCFCMTYGDGDGKVLKSLVAMDVAGHEMAHGVTSTTAKLTYSGESGGLNEGTSDIFGTMVEYYANNASDTGDYLIGEKIAGPTLGKPSLRNMINPGDDGKSADCWYSNVGNLDVHYSSGVTNHLYYLLAEGTSNGAPSRTCNAGDTRLSTGKGTVQGIGRQKAEKIWYRALTVYMTSNTNFAGARQATIKAATDLHGANSNEVSAVLAAWKAVNVN